jgi:hypothetical protein
VVTTAQRIDAGDGQTTPETESSRPEVQEGGEKESVLGELLHDYGHELTIEGAKSPLEFLNYVSRTTTQSQFSLFSGTATQEGQFIVDEAGNVIPAVRTTLTGQGVQVTGPQTSRYGIVPEEELNVATRTEQTVSSTVQATENGVTQVAGSKVTTISEAAPVLEDSGLLGRAAKFLAGKAGGALIGAVSTVAENADYSNRQGVEKYVAATLDTGAGATIGFTSVVGGNFVAGVADVTETVGTEGAGAVLIPVVHVAVSTTVGAGISTGGNYVYKNYIRAPAIQFVTSAVTTAASWGNALINYSTGH